MPRKRGPRGSGSIIRRTVGTGDRKRVVYQARWSATVGGMRTRGSETFAFRSDAEWWLRQAGRGTAPDAERTLADYLEAWLTSKRDLRASTRLQYANHVRKHIVPALGSVPLLRLERRQVEAFVDERSRHVSPSTHRRLSPSTVRAVLTTLRSALEEGVPRELPDNPARRVHAPRVDRPPVREVGAAEATRILAAVKDTWVEPIARFLFRSGLRIGEALALNQGDVDWKAGKVKVRHSKTTPRTVVISPDGMAALRMAKDRAPRIGPKEPVFFGIRATANGARERLDRNSVAHALPRLLTGASIERLTAHGLRHAHATVALERGTPIEVIAAQLGHKNPTMTRNVYAHVTERLQRQHGEDIDEAVKG